MSNEFIDIKIDDLFDDNKSILLERYRDIQRGLLDMGFELGKSNQEEIDKISLFPCVFGDGEIDNLGYMYSNNENIRTKDIVDFINSKLS